MSWIRKNPRAVSAFLAGVALTLLMVALPAWALSCNNCVTSGDIVNGEVKAPDIGTGQVTSSEIATGAVRTAELATGAVTAPDIGKLPAVRVYNSTAETIGSGGQTTLTFDSEAFDNGNMHSTTTDTSRLVAPIAGIYEIGANLQWDNGGDTDSYRQFYIRKNDAEYLANERLPGSSLAVMDHNVSTLAKLSAGDYVEIDVFHIAGNDLDITTCSNSSCPVFWMRYASAA